MKHVTTLVNLLRRSVCRCWPRDPGLSKLRSLALLRRIRRMRRQLGEGRGVVRDLASILARLRGWIETLELRLWRWRGASAIGGRFLRKRVGHYNCDVLVNDCHRIGTERGLAQLVVSRVPLLIFPSIHGFGRAPSARIRACSAIRLKSSAIRSIAAFAIGSSSRSAISRAHAFARRLSAHADGRALLFTMSNSAVFFVPAGRCCARVRSSLWRPLASRGRRMSQVGSIAWMRNVGNSVVGLA
jgi:hypothetical protein